MAEQEYAADLKSAAREGLGVRLPSAPPEVQQDKAERRLTFRTDEYQKVYYQTY